MIIAIDFDGTCVEHEFPDVGADVPGAVQTLQSLAMHHDLILWTMRSGAALRDAVQWFSERGIQLYGVNTNPEQTTWTDSPKAYAQLYIDDAALGCPLTQNRRLDGRPYVDWFAVRAALESAQVLPLDKAWRAMQ